ncbi:MAG: RNase H-like domain-containing protein, partial [bacterium]
DDFNLHLNQLRQSLTILQDCGFIINPMKYAWAVQSTEYLGYVFTQDGDKPMSNKIDAVMRLSRPTTSKQIRHFIGLVNYYRDMWPHRAHILAPLTRLTSNKVKFEWGEEEEAAFKKMKSLITSDVLLRFPDHSKPFNIYTDMPAIFSLALLLSKMVILLRIFRVNSLQLNNDILLSRRNCCLSWKH